MSFDLESMRIAGAIKVKWCLHTTVGCDILRRSARVRVMSWTRKSVGTATCHVNPRTFKRVSEEEFNPEACEDRLSLDRSRR